MRDVQAELEVLKVDSFLEKYLTARQCALFGTYWYCKILERSILRWYRAKLMVPCGLSIVLIYLVFSIVA